jgi:pyridoxine 5-phosphate synthase
MSARTPVGRLRLGVNIDHVATVRNARGGAYPDPIRAAKVAEAAGADGITAHLREDRRHISDADIEGLMAALALPLNFEMAATEEMQAIALRHRPHAVCIVPERREERTTEGGLEVARDENRLAHFIAPLREAGCRVSIFIAADRAQIEAAARIGAAVVELHTGAYCDLHAEGATRSATGNSRGSPTWRPSRMTSGSRSMPVTGSPTTRWHRSPPFRRWWSSTSAIS